MEIVRADWEPTFSLFRRGRTSREPYSGKRSLVLAQEPQGAHHRTAQVVGRGQRLSSFYTFSAALLSPARLSK